jgi:Right handed beta helix region
MRSISTALIAASLICLAAAPAHALRPNTYVASYGTDSGTCSYAAPCRTFTYALSQVQAGGVVTALDSAGNSPFTIDKAVTIMAPPGVSPSIQAPANGKAITINAGPNDVVVLSGLTLSGENSATYAIDFNSGQELEVINCTIRAFTGYGVYVVPTTASSILISNTVIADLITGTGIWLRTFYGGPIIAAIDHVTITNNRTGILVEADNFQVEAAIKDSSIENNNTVGVNVVGGNTCPANLATLVLRSVSFNETPNPIYVADCSNTYLSHVVQSLALPLGYNTGVIFASHNNVHVYSDGTNLTSAPPNSFELWSTQ